MQYKEYKKKRYVSIDALDYLMKSSAKKA